MNKKFVNLVILLALLFATAKLYIVELNYIGDALNAQETTENESSGEAGSSEESASSGEAGSGEEQGGKKDNNKESEEDTEEVKYDTVEYNLSLKEVRDNEEVWNTYTVDVIEAREDYGTYWLDNSKTEGYKIKIKFNEDNTVSITEHLDNEVKVRSLAKLNGGSISIKHYNKIEEQELEKEETTVEGKRHGN